MKTKEAMKIIDAGWVKKPKGFRVHFQRRVESEWVTEYVPDVEDKPLRSDVSAWRMAWKLAQASASYGPDAKSGDIVNIYVVDDSGKAIDYYATNQSHVFNPVDSP